MIPQKQLPADVAESMAKLVNLEVLRINAKHRAGKLEPQADIIYNAETLAGSFTDFGTTMFFWGQKNALDNLLTSAQVAEKLGVTDGLVRRLAKKMQVGKKIHGSRAWLFLPQDVASLEERNKSAGQPVKEY